MDNRRVEDIRMNKMEKTIERMNTDLGLVKQKIFNGFSSSIASTEDKVSYIDERNTLDHDELKSSINVLSKKFDKMLWFMVTSSIGITSGIILSIVKGWI